MTDSISLESPDRTPEPPSPPEVTAAVSGEINCPSCKREMPVRTQLGTDNQPCPFCRKSVTIHTFPRLFVPETTESAKGELSHDGDATCSFYPELRAEHVCEECGCFMSEKASISWSGKTLCLPCLHSLREKKGKDEYRASVRIYDNTALGLTLPFLVFFPLFFVTLFTAPVALYYVIRYRKSSRGIIPRSAARWWFALFLTIAVNGAWIFLIVSWIALIVEGFSS